MHIGANESLGLVTTYREVESIWDSFYNANSELQTDREDGRTDDAYTLWGRNLLNNEYINGVCSISADTFGTPFVSIFEPRTWGMEFKYQY